MMVTIRITQIVIIISGHLWGSLLLDHMNFQDILNVELSRSSGLDHDVFLAHFFDFLLLKL